MYVDCRVQTNDRNLFDEYVVGPDMSYERIGVGSARVSETSPGESILSIKKS